MRIQDSGGQHRHGFAEQEDMKSGGTIPREYCRTDFAASHTKDGMNPAAYQPCSLRTTPPEQGGARDVVPPSFHSGWVGGGSRVNLRAAFFFRGAGSKAPLPRVRW